eukprot:10494249-Lingulodinium_polyedra.AAC.1
MRRLTTSGHASTGCPKESTATCKWFFTSRPSNKRCPARKTATTIPALHKSTDNCGAIDTA